MKRKTAEPLNRVRQVRRALWLTLAAVVGTPLLVVVATVAVVLYVGLVIVTLPLELLALAVSQSSRVSP